MIADLSGLTETQLRLLYSLAVNPRKLRRGETRAADGLYASGLIDRRDTGSIMRATAAATRALLKRERAARKAAQRELAKERMAREEAQCRARDLSRQLSSSSGGLFRGCP